MKFEETDGHDHWHFQNAAKYSLYAGTQSAPGTVPYGFSNKVGFCFLDIGHGDPTYNPLPAPPHPADSPNNFKYAGLVAPRAFYHDATLHPAQPCLNQPTAPPPTRGGSPTRSTWASAPGGGTSTSSPFRSSTWTSRTPCRATTGCKSEVDPNNLLREMPGKETNAAAFSAKASVVPGYIAKPVNAGQISGVKESTSKITLSSTKYWNRHRAHRRGSVQDHRAAGARHGEARDRHRRLQRVVLGQRCDLHEDRLVQRWRHLQVRRPSGRQPVPAQPRVPVGDDAGRQRQRRHHGRHQRLPRVGLHRDARAARRNGRAQR